MNSLINLYTKNGNFTESIRNSVGRYNYSAFNNIIPPMISENLTFEPTYITSAKLQVVDSFSVSNTKLDIVSESSIPTANFVIRKGKFFEVWNIVSFGMPFEISTGDEKLCRVKIVTDKGTLYSELFLVYKDSIAPWFFREMSPDGSRYWSSYGFWTNSATDLWA